MTTIPHNIITNVIGHSPYVYGEESYDGNIVAVYWWGVDCDGYGYHQITYHTPGYHTKDIDKILDYSDGHTSYRILSEAEFREVYADLNILNTDAQQGWEDDRF